MFICLKSDYNHINHIYVKFYVFILFPNTYKSIYLKMIFFSLYSSIACVPV